jgi:broad specificity phosphatase PhoE
MPTTTFVFVRHAQGYHNLDAIKRGDIAYHDNKNLDAELTNYGIYQAQINNLGNETFDAIYSSPMKRCRQTLLNIYPQSEYLSVMLDDRLIEQPQGHHICNKRVEKNIIINDIPNNWNIEKVSNRNPYILNQNIDEYRLDTFTKDIKNKYPNRKVLIITHGQWISNWLLKYKSSPLFINNCEIIRMIL